MNDLIKKIPKWCILPIWLVVFALEYGIWSGIVNAFTSEDKNILFGVILVIASIVLLILAGWFSYQIANKEELESKK